MQPHAIQNSQPQFPIQELEQIEAVIQASLRLVATLEDRKTTLSAELERITQPQVAPVPPPTIKTIRRGFEYRGVAREHWYHIDMHIDLLHRLWTEFPDRRDAMARAIGCHGRTRKYVATSLADLFADQSPEFARQHGRPLIDGWYVDTNLNVERMRRILPAAVNAAGLKWGKDVKVYWRRAQIS